eukprot:TRINITY_DN100943_c0_g1_i1.p1 TRINITY_DN100943_c0_g1~~TRINITY_DN100943_c0_g1_i1.p1  ORF type:complete len:498 (-),score=70.31 TRINITY_DN100943_c0_g1_i1:52-1545(-)
MAPERPASPRSKAIIARATVAGKMLPSSPGLRGLQERTRGTPPPRGKAAAGGACRRILVGCAEGPAHDAQEGAPQAQMVLSASPQMAMEGRLNEPLPAFGRKLRGGWGDISLQRPYKGVHDMFSPETSIGPLDEQAYPSEGESPRSYRASPASTASSFPPRRCGTLESEEWSQHGRLHASNASLMSHSPRPGGEDASPCDADLAALAEEATPPPEQRALTVAMMETTGGLCVGGVSLLSTKRPSLMSQEAKRPMTTGRIPGNAQPFVPDAFVPPLPETPSQSDAESSHSTSQVASSSAATQVGSKPSGLPDEPSRSVESRGDPQMSSRDSETLAATAPTAFGSTESPKYCDLVATPEKKRMPVAIRSILRGVPVRSDLRPRKPWQLLGGSDEKRWWEDPELAAEGCTQTEPEVKEMLPAWPSPSPKPQYERLVITQRVSPEEMDLTSWGVLQAPRPYVTKEQRYVMETNYRYPGALQAYTKRASSAPGGRRRQRFIN